MVATFGWAVAVVLSRAILLRGVDTLTLVPLRMLFAMAGLLVIVATTPRFRSRSAEAWKKGAVLGVVGMAIPNLLFTRALEDLPASLGGLLIALIPIATVIAAHFMLKEEKFQKRSIPGLAIALAGSAVLVGIGGTSLEGVDNLWRGVGFSMVGVVLAGINGALTRRFAKAVPGESLILPQFTTCTAALLVIVPVLFQFDLSTINTGSLGLIATLGIFGTIVPFASFLIGASINPSWRLGLTGYTVPVLAVTLAVIFLGESLTTGMILGATLIITGVVVADRGSRQPAHPGTLPST